MKVTANYHGSFGEIIEGKFKGMDILCSCPINLFIIVTIFGNKYSVINKKYYKCNIFLRNILKEWKFERYIDNINISVESDIPIGKGFSSSTSDLCALYNGLLKLFNKKYNEEELIRSCIKVEPTDSIIFNKFTIFDYKQGNYKKTLGDYIDFNILVFEGNRIIDTVQFNRTILESLNNVDDLTHIMIKSVKERNIEDIAYCSTESIIRNNSRLQYDILPLILKIMKDAGGLGIIGSHSGDVLGIIYKEEFNEKIFKKYLYLLKKKMMQ